MIAALILAGGQGTRFDTRGQPKQFTEIGGQPLFIHALKTYIDLPNVSTVVLVANPTFMEPTLDALGEFGLAADVKVVAGGDTRQESVRNGLAAVNDMHDVGDDDAVILHNAASPNTPADTITRCIAALDAADVAQAYIPELRTILEMDGENVGAVLPRSKLASSCDPTIYRAAALQRVMQRQEELGLRGDTTVDISLSLGMRIRLVESEQSNIKITARWDLDALKAAMLDA